MLLGPKDVTSIGIIGGGVQAIWQLRFLTAITACREVVIKTRSIESAQKFIDKMKVSNCELDREWNITIFSDESRFKKCQLIHTLSPAKSPCLKKVLMFEKLEKNSNLSFVFFMSIFQRR